MCSDGRTTSISDSAAVDRAGGFLKDRFAKRVARLDKDWLKHLRPVVVGASNKLVHNALHGRAPSVVLTDDGLRFHLRMGSTTASPWTCAASAGMR